MIHIYEDTIGDYGDDDIYVHDGVNYFYVGTLRYNIYTGENVLLVVSGVVRGNIYMGKNSVLRFCDILDNGKIYLNEGVYADLGDGIIAGLKLNGGIADLNCMLRSIEE